MVEAVVQAVVVVVVQRPFDLALRPALLRTYRAMRVCVCLCTIYHRMFRNSIWLRSVDSGVMRRGGGDVMGRDRIESNPNLTCDVL